MSTWKMIKLFRKIKNIILQIKDEMDGKVVEETVESEEVEQSGPKLR